MAQLDGERQREIFAHPHELEAPPGAICGSDQAAGLGGIGNDSGIHKTHHARPGIAMYFNTSSSRCDYGCGNGACQDLPAAPANLLIRLAIPGGRTLPGSRMSLIAPAAAFTVSIYSQ
jgi:hypothetical protein